MILKYKMWTIGSTWHAPYLGPWQKNPHSAQLCLCPTYCTSQAHLGGDIGPSQVSRHRAKVLKPSSPEFWPASQGCPSLPSPQPSQDRTQLSLVHKARELKQKTSNIQCYRDLNTFAGKNRNGGRFCAAVGDIFIAQTAKTVTEIRMEDGEICTV